MRVLVIANPQAGAGAGARRWNELQLPCPYEKVFTAKPGDGIAAARAAAGDYDVIVAAGGDGTVNEVAAGVLLSPSARAVLAVLPIGTGNDVARMLDLNDLPRACAALTAGHTRLLDVIEVTARENDAPATRFALLYASVGFAGELLRQTTPRVKRWFGARFCYSVGFARALFTYRAPRVTASFAGKSWTGRAFLVSAGNAEVVGSGTMRLSPGARIDDGLLNINLIPAMPRWLVAWHFPKLLRGTHPTIPGAEYFTGESISIVADPIVPLQLDGEVALQTPATFRVLPRKLRVIAPSP